MPFWLQRESSQRCRGSRSSAKDGGSRSSCGTVCGAVSRHAPVLSCIAYNFFCRMKASAERMSDTYLERFDLSLTWFDPTDSTNTSVSHISDLSTTDAARGQAGHKAAADVDAHVRRDANTHTDRILYAAATLVRVRGVQAVAQANPCSLSAVAEEFTAPSQMV